MINHRIYVTYLGEDISEKVMSAEIKPRIETVIGYDNPTIKLPVREIILTLYDGEVIHTNTFNCEVTITKGTNQ